MVLRSLSRRRRLLFAVFVVVLAAATVEGISWLALETVDFESSARGGSADDDDPAVSVPSTTQLQVLHPYTGYVIDPGGHEAEQLRERYGWAVSDIGFPQDPSMPEHAPEDAVTIGIFGGSVAAIHAAMGRLLKSRLERDDIFSGRPVVVQGFALSGFKQPQQLMTLGWLVALDRVPDVVINIDGFNEVALPLSENLPHGLHPAYPRGWQHRVQGVPDPVLLGIQGEAAFLRGRREAIAAYFSGSMLGITHTGRIMWQFADGLMGAHLENLRSRFDQYPGRPGSMLTSGPDFVQDDRTENLRIVAEIWRRSSIAMNDLCAGQGCLYLHFLQPNQYVPGSKPLSLQERHKAFRDDHPYRAGVVDGYPLLQAAGEDLRNRGIYFTDLTRIFAQTESSLYIDSCCHFDWQGNSLVADAIVDVLREVGPGIE